MYFYIFIYLVRLAVLFYIAVVYQAPTTPKLIPCKCKTNMAINVLLILILILILSVSLEVFM